MNETLTILYVNVHDDAVMSGIGVITSFARLANKEAIVGVN